VIYQLLKVDKINFFETETFASPVRYRSGGISKKMNSVPMFAFLPSSKKVKKIIVG